MVAVLPHNPVTIFFFPRLSSHMALIHQSWEQGGREKRSKNKFLLMGTHIIRRSGRALFIRNGTT